MMNHYETVFIASPVLSEGQMKETVGKFKKLMQNSDVEIVHEENWGMRKLAYPIKNKTSGYYYLIDFKSSGEFIQKLETEFRRDEQVIRFLTFKMDKYAEEYSEKRRKNMKAKEEQAKESETVTQTEKEK